MEWLVSCAVQMKFCKEQIRKKPCANFDKTRGFFTHLSLVLLTLLTPFFLPFFAPRGPPFGHLICNQQEKKTILLKIELFFTMKKKKNSQTNKLKLIYFGIFLFQEYLQSCQRLMEEVLHFNVTETPSDKIENGSTPSTPTDLQEIHFWQRRLVDCHRTFRVCANLSIVCKYCNKGLEFSQIAVVFSFPSV